MEKPPGDTNTSTLKKEYSKNEDFVNDKKKNSNDKKSKNVLKKVTKKQLAVFIIVVFIIIIVIGLGIGLGT